ncbi:hypothetical protein LCGC14_0387900 [marine sediment metagenome]|uniref:Uncharacterized protein n=1 Tax=marine sediment metagenome TaxID=412755 RepID=A0A0F9W9H3_9ZZZZ
MLEAKDTVMGNDIINPSEKGLTWATLITECLNEEMVKPSDIEQFLLNIIDDNKKAQAEISFKAGVEQEHKVMIGVAVDEGNKAYKAGKEATKKQEKLAWYILDEIAVKHSATHTGSPPPSYKENPKPWSCPICDRAEEAMRLLEKPNHDECKVFYNQRVGEPNLKTGG